MKRLVTTSLLIFYLVSILMVTSPSFLVKANDVPWGLTENDNTTTTINITWNRNTSVIMEVATNGFNWAIHDRNSPQAVYNETMNWTIVAWGGTPSVDDPAGGWTADPYIRIYNHTSNTWSVTHQIGESRSDHHGCPSIAINETGFIYVWFSGHITNVDEIVNVSSYSITDPSFNITAWGPAFTMTKSGTYHDIITLDNGTIVAFLRNTGPTWEINISYDSGKTWQEHNIVYMSDGGSPYQYVSGYKYYNDKIHLAWNNASGSFDRDNAFYAYLNLTDMNCYNITNTSLGTLINSSEALNYCLVKDTTGTVNRISNEVQVDVDPTTEAPYITYAHNPASNKVVWWNFSYYNYSSNLWINEHMFLTNCSSGSCYLQVNSSTDILGFLSRNATLEQWYYDGNTWQFNETIYTYNASRENETGMMRNLQHLNDHYKWENIPNNSEIELVFSPASDMYGTWDNGYLYPEDNPGKWNLTVYTYGHEHVYTNIRYSTSNNLTNHSSGEEAYNGTGTNVNITNLTANTTYYIRAFTYSPITGWNETGGNIINETTRNIPVVRFTWQTTIAITDTTPTSNSVFRIIGVLMMLSVIMGLIAIIKYR